MAHRTRLCGPVERGRPGGTDAPDAETFYVQFVGPAIRDAGLDGLLTQIPSTSEARPDPEHVPLALETHRALTETIRRLTGRAVRSFASKYLHFHRPDVFPIYDSRADEKVREHVRGQIGPSVPPGDKDYRPFFARALALRNAIRDQHGLDLSYRQIDRLLLAY